MGNVVLVRGARQLLTLRGPGGPRRGSALQQLGIVEDGALLIVDGVIRDIGPTRRVENLELARRAEEIDAHGRVVMPGFVDSHTHLVSGAPPLDLFERSVGDPAAMVEQDVRHVRETPSKKLRAEAASVLAACLRHGTTTLEVKSGGALNESGEMKIFRVLSALEDQPVDIVPTVFSGTTMPTEFAGSPDAYVGFLCERLLPIVRRRKFAAFAAAACGHGSLTPPQARRFLETARSLGFSLRLHAGRFPHRDSIALAVEMGAVSVTQAETISPRDLELLAESAAIATLLPGVVFHLGLSQYPPARQLLDRGAAVSLASDFGRGATPCYSMQMVLALACRYMGMTAAEAISATTINGAHALLRADRSGSLENGKDADLNVLEVSDYREIAYRFGGNAVSLAMKRGKIVYNSSEERWNLPGPQRAGG